MTKTLGRLLAIHFLAGSRSARLIGQTKFIATLKRQSRLHFGKALIEM